MKELILDEQFNDEHSASSRRTFLKGAIAFAGGLAFSGCGQALDNHAAHQDQLPQVQAETLSGGINVPAQATAQAERLNPPKPQTPKGKFYYPGEVVRKIITNENFVVLTFDDGPDDRHELQLAQIAKERGYEGKLLMLFVSNNLLAYQHVGLELRDRGYIIGNHTKTHSRYDAKGEVAEMGPAQEDFNAVLGSYPWYFRAAGGTMSPLIDNECARLDMAYIWTTGDERDWESPRVKPETMNGLYLKYTHPGYISLRHSGGTHDQTVNAMHGLLDIIEGLGQQVVTMDEALSRRQDGFNPTGRLTEYAQLDSGLIVPDEFSGADGPIGYDLAADIEKHRLGN